MQILAWLVPSVVVMVGAMVWVSWAARRQGAVRERTEADQTRLAAALAKDHPAVRRRVAVRRERSTGIVVRPSRAVRRAGEGTTTRYSA